MAILLAQAGGGVYARLQSSVDGWIALEFGEVTGGAFFAAGEAKRAHVPLFDGAGWDLQAVACFVQQMRPVKVESKPLTVLLDGLRRQYPVELQRYLQLRYKDPDDWARIARLVRRCAEYELISDLALKRYAHTRYPLMVRQAAQTALATAI